MANEENKVGLTLFGQVTYNHFFALIYVGIDTVLALEPSKMKIMTKTLRACSHSLNKSFDIIFGLIQGGAFFAPPPWPCNVVEITGPE